MNDKMIEEMQSCNNCVCKVVCYERANIEEIEGKESDAMKSWEEYVKQYGCQYYQPKIPKGSVVLDRQEHQKYCAYKIIEPQIKGCLDRERELEKQVAELEDKIENGTLIELPCKVGDTVYVITKKRDCSACYLVEDYCHHDCPFKNDKNDLVIKQGKITHIVFYRPYPFCSEIQIEIMKLFN